ncbi:hypothetical protein NC652_034752 [Populus alba x Populus x berolinensis]|nr:hypothetical protein NC652_034752 [Populus alba x Populus x berolinensis]
MGDASYNTFCGYPPEIVKKMPKKDLAEEVWRLQAALGEQTEITKYSQQEKKFYAGCALRERSVWFCSRVDIVSFAAPAVRGVKNVQFVVSLLRSAYLYMMFSFQRFVIWMMNWSVQITYNSFSREVLFTADQNFYFCAFCLIWHHGAILVRRLANEFRIADHLYGKIIEAFINGSKWQLWIERAHLNIIWLIHAVVYLAAIYENVVSNGSNYALWNLHLCIHENWL